MASTADDIHELDELDEQILYHLMTDARNNTPPQIAEEVGVTPVTVRNRISGLEENGVIQGYRVHVDFERSDGRLACLFLCNVSFADRMRLARAAYEIPGVINIRLLMDGRRNVQVLAVGDTTADLRRVGTTLAEIGVDIADEMLLEREVHKPYELFDPDAEQANPFSDEVAGTTGSDDLTELSVGEGALVAGSSLSETMEDPVFDDELLVVSIERNGELITPKGDTVIEAGDVVRLFSTQDLTAEMIGAFSGAVPA